MLVERAALAVIGALAIGAVAAGLYVVGGPETGRMERRDQQRQQDLIQLSSYVRCLANAEGKALPDSLHRNAACNADTPFDDPFTGAPYRYEKVSATGYRLCAGFERPDLLPRTTLSTRSYEPSTGCVLFTYRP